MNDGFEDRKRLESDAKVVRLHPRREGEGPGSYMARLAALMGYVPTEAREPGEEG